MLFTSHFEINIFDHTPLLLPPLVSLLSLSLSPPPSLSLPLSLSLSPHPCFAGGGGIRKPRSKGLMILVTSAPSCWKTTDNVASNLMITFVFRNSSTV